MTAPTPEYLRQIAEASERALNNVGDGDWNPQDAMLVRAVTALRAAADQLEAVPNREQVLDAITHGNPYSTCDFEEEIADRIMAILTADTAPQEDRDES